MLFIHPSASSEFSVSAQCPVLCLDTIQGLTVNSELLPRSLRAVGGITKLGSVAFGQGRQTQGKGPGNTYFRLRRPCSLCGSCSALTLAGSCRGHCVNHGYGRVLVKLFTEAQVDHIWLLGPSLCDPCSRGVIKVWKQRTQQLKPAGDSQTYDRGGDALFHLPLEVPR